MKTYPMKASPLNERSRGHGKVTAEMIRHCAIELAAFDGRSAEHISKSDWEQARRELMGEPAQLVRLPLKTS